MAAADSCNACCCCSPPLLPAAAATAVTDAGSRSSGRQAARAGPPRLHRASGRRRWRRQRQAHGLEPTVLLLLLLLLPAAAATAFITSPPQQRRGRASSVRRALAPLPLPEEEAAAFALPLGYRLGLVEGTDLPRLTRLLTACFPPDEPMAFPQGSDFVSRRLLRPVHSLVSAVAGATTRFEMRYGLLSRHGERFARPDLAGQSLESLSLGVEEEATGRLVAVVELCMRTPDGNLISSIKGPALRFDASCRPYLCNLAVLPPYRGQGLGRALAGHAERVVARYWGEQVIYLHLDETDPAAAALWASLGYTRVLGAGPSGWYQEMMLEAAAQAGKRLAYHAKWLERERESSKEPKKPGRQQQQEEQAEGEEEAAP